MGGSLSSSIISPLAINDLNDRRGKKGGDIYVLIDLYRRKARKSLALLELIHKQKHKIRFVFSFEIQEVAA